MLALLALAGTSGCHLILPDVSHQPVIHNPFPQLSRVAVAPFFNQSDEPTVDGRKFAMAYFSELQATPGFEVVPLGVVEEAILENQVDLSSAGEARRLARILNVDVVVVGSVTDYTPYYPPRCGMRVEWYAANPGFHEIPPGYGLPWGTPEEEFIPQPLVFEAEMAVAKAQLRSHTPHCEQPPMLPPALSSDDVTPPQLFMPVPSADPMKQQGSGSNGTKGDQKTPPEEDASETSVNETQYELLLAEEELPIGGSGADAPLAAGESDSADVAGIDGAIGADGVALAPGTDSLAWPDKRALIPNAACTAAAPCVPHAGPVMTHTRIYHGHDDDFTEALATYYHFQNDARFGGWQNYLQRSDDFIRFCCHLHIAEMLSARGGADETRVVWRWPDCR